MWKEAKKELVHQLGNHMVKPLNHLPCNPFGEGFGDLALK